MRNLTILCLVAAATVLCACGGSKSRTMAPPPEPTATASETAAAAPTGASLAEASASASSSASTTPPAPERAAPTLKGSLMGKPFEAAAACVAGVTPAGKAYIEIYDAKGADVSKSCGMLAQDKGARKIGLELGWKAGEKIDLAALKVENKDAPPLFVMERISEKKADRKDVGKDFKPKGEIEVLRAADRGAVGRIRITLTAGKDKLEGEVDVEVKVDVNAP
jgi:hypothetical protein